LTTGTGFPNVFYISYAFYKDYFPLLALSTIRSRWRSAITTPAQDSPAPSA
jgi:squalene-hopene/tetraprenyl-beta-curcumene cyclase